jgi:hypothetical protein
VVTRDCEPPRESAVLAVTHGGRRAGQVIEWRSSVLGLDAVLLVDESMIGDGLLALVDKHGELPVSPSFRGDGTRHSTGVQWRNLSVPEVAVVGAGELPWARVCGDSPHEFGPVARQPRVWTCAGKAGKAVLLSVFACGAEDPPARRRPVS